MARGRSRDPLEAETDAQALEKASALNLPHECEIWLRDRRIGRVPAATTD